MPRLIAERNRKMAISARAYVRGNTMRGADTRANWTPGIGSAGFVTAGANGFGLPCDQSDLQRRIIAR